MSLLDRLPQLRKSLAALAILTLVGLLGSAGLLAAETATPEKTEETDPAAEPEAASDAAPQSGDSKDQVKEDLREKETEGDDPNEPKKKQGPNITARYKDGVHIETKDNSFYARIRWRAQLRLTDLSSPDLVGEEDGVEEESGFLVRRARFKLDGYFHRPWLNYYLEYGIAGGFMLTFQFDVTKKEEIGVRAGQYKITYNRERVDSSGKQQFVDRSIVNSPFTLDRQQGIQLMGRLGKGSLGDSNYVLGWYTGTGRGGALDSDNRGMYLARWQWNFFGRVLPFSQSDVKRYKKPMGSFALAASSNISQYTRFSSSGGGQLPGFDPGVPGQYKLEQWMAEFAYMHKGLSIQSEYHFKEVDDRVNLEITELEGWYGQIGYFFHETFDKFPKPLEFAFRAAAVDTVEGVEIPADRELTLCANWFFNGHNNKLTMDVSRLKSTLFEGSEDSGWRARLQWDVSF